MVQFVIEFIEDRPETPELKGKFENVKIYGFFNHQNQSGFKYH